jgi:hypothetical protein
MADFANLNVSSTATIANLQVQTLQVSGDLTVQGLVTVQDITVNGHIITAGNTPTFSALTAAGEHAVVTISGNDTSGTITITTGDPGQAAAGNQPAVVGPGKGDIAKLVFGKAYDKPPQVNLTPGNIDAAALRVWSGTSTDYLTISSIDAPTPNTSYTYYYFVRQ